MVTKKIEITKCTDPEEKELWFVKAQKISYVKEIRVNFNIKDGICYTQSEIVPTGDINEENS